MPELDPIRERALRRELRMARSTRPHDVPGILAALGEAPKAENRGGATADRAAAKPARAAKKPKSDDAA